MTNELYQKAAMDFYKKGELGLAIHYAELAGDMEFSRKVRKEIKTIVDEEKHIEDIMRENKYGVAIISKNPEEAAQKPAFKAEWNKAITV